MKQNAIRFAGLAFTLLAVAPSASRAETQDEIRGKYYTAIMCGTYMSAFTIYAQRAKEKELEAAFEAATERSMRETVSLGAKLGITEAGAIDEFKNTAKINANSHPSYNEAEIEQYTTSCAPEILPLLK